MLALEDPRDPTNDLAKGSYNFERQIRPALDFAYQQLSAPSRSDESILARIVRSGPHVDDHMSGGQHLGLSARPQ